MDDIKPIFVFDGQHVRAKLPITALPSKERRPAVERLADFLIDEVRTRGLADVKFFPCSDPSATDEELAEATLAAMRNSGPSNPMPFDGVEF